MFLNNMKKKIFGILLLLSLFLPSLSLATTTMDMTTNPNPSPLDRLKNVAEGPYGTVDETSVATIVGTIARVLMSLLGIIFVVLIIVSGYQWMTAGGNEDAVKKSKERMTNAIIGLVIVLSAWAIWSFVNTFLIGNGTTGTGAD
jgi:type IV secretory pathway VirB2 component (pilin)